MKKARIATVLLLCILLVSGLACGEKTWQLSTFAVGQGNIQPGEGTFSDGDWIIVTAIPASGWSFDHWGVHLGGSENPVSLLVDSDKMVYAYFISAPTPTPTREVTSCHEARLATYEYFDSLAQSPPGAVAVSNYYLALNHGDESCAAYDDEYNILMEYGDDWMKKANVGEVLYFLFKDDIALTVDGKSLWEMLPEPSGTDSAECIWEVMSEDGRVIPINPNAMSVKAEMMK
jgi:hypothetical protein